MHIDFDTFYTLAEFQEFTPETQIEYLNYICEKYRVSAYAIGPYVFGMDGEEFARFLKIRGLFEAVNPKKYKSTKNSRKWLSRAVRTPRDTPPSGSNHLCKDTVLSIQWHIGTRPEKPGDYWAITIYEADYESQPTKQKVAGMDLLRFEKRVEKNDPRVVKGEPEDGLVWYSDLRDIEIYAWAPVEETPFPDLPADVVPYYDFQPYIADE